MDVQSQQSIDGTEADSVFVDVYDRLKAMASRQRRRDGAPAMLCTIESKLMAAEKLRDIGS